MVISPLSNAPVFIDSNSKVISNTTRPSISQPDSILIGLPSIPSDDTTVVGTAAETLPFVLIIDNNSWENIQESNLYKIEIPRSMHNKGRNPFIVVYEDKNDGFIQVLPDEIKLTTTGDITVEISTPISGKIVIFN
jgi:hypothetical protein